MADNSFSAKVAAWAEQTEADLAKVFQQAATGLAQEVRQSKEEGGNLPVVTGNLQRSLAASTIGMPPILWRQEEFNGSEAAIVAVIETAQIGQTVYLGFQAPYAHKIEEKAGFVRLASQRWPSIVEQAVTRTKNGRAA